MGHEEALARWGEEKLVAAGRCERGEVDLSTVRVKFSFEEAWAYSEYTAGGGVARMEVTATLTEDATIRRARERGYTESEIAGSLATHGPDIVSWDETVDDGHAVDVGDIVREMMEIERQDAS